MTICGRLFWDTGLATLSSEERGREIQELFTLKKGFGR